LVAAQSSLAILNVVHHSKLIRRSSFVIRPCCFEALIAMIRRNVWIAVISMAQVCLAPRAGFTETLQFNFSQGDNGFVADFTDYPPGEEAFHELTAGVRPLPPNLGAATSLFISGNNRSDDLFMYYKRRLDGLLPDTPYRLGFDLQFATEAEFGSFGIGGSPAHSVFVKAGASMMEPRSVVVDGFYRLTVDKGQQSEAGTASLVLGDVSKSENASPGFELVTRASGADMLEAQTSPTGELWLFFGTDSGHEGVTSLYYTNFAVTIEPVREPAALALIVTGLAVFALSRLRGACWRCGVLLFIRRS
jgi:hypothetical protein